jgi:hypothetical protein
MTSKCNGFSGPTLPNIDRCRALCFSVYQSREEHSKTVAPYDTIDGHRRRFYCDGGGTHETYVVCQKNAAHGVEIVVRGTGSPWEVMTDMKCWQSKMPNCNRPDYGFVHHGFLESALSVVRPIRQWMAESPIPIVVTITGHSLGAGIATLLAPMLSDLSQKTIVVTFGSPRVGDLTFMHAYNTSLDIHHIRVTNDDDPISYVPVIGYHHVGHSLVLPRPPPPTIRRTVEELKNREWYMRCWDWIIRNTMHVTVYVPSAYAHSLYEYKPRIRRLPLVRHTDDDDGSGLLSCNPPPP